MAILERRDYDPMAEEMRKQELAMGYREAIGHQNPDADEERINMAAERTAELLLPMEDMYKLGMLPHFAFSSSFHGLEVVISKERHEEA